MKVKLEDVVEALEMASADAKWFLNKETGKVVYIDADTEYVLMEDTPLDELPEWQREIVASARDVEDNPDNHIELPSQFEIHEYQIKRDFCETVSDPDWYSSLRDALRGRGAHRRFKDVVYRLGIEKKWLGFRDDMFRKKAIEWCDENDVEWEI